MKPSIETASGMRRSFVNPGVGAILPRAHTQIKLEDFSLEATLDSGQVFGFSKIADRVYEGYIAGRRLKLWQEGTTLQSDLPPDAASETILRNYFDLDRDLSPVYEFLAEDERLVPALRRFRGLRLIRQDSWEALACFILSSNNNIKRIQGIWKNLSAYFDCAFPTARQIARTHERILRQIGLGYRAPYLLNTASFLATNPFTLDRIRKAPYAEARELVIAFPGIGPKVADCVLLYGFQKYESFPVDVWILRALRKLYFKNRALTEKKARAFGQKRWENLAGYVQQYLFHGARNGIL